MSKLKYADYYYYYYLHLRGINVSYCLALLLLGNLIKVKKTIIESLTQKGKEYRYPYLWEDTRRSLSRPETGIRTRKGKCSDDIPSIVCAEHVLMEHIRNIQQQLTTFQNQGGLKLGTLRLPGQSGLASVDPTDRIKWKINMGLISTRKSRRWFYTLIDFRRQKRTILQ